MYLNTVFKYNVFKYCPALIKLIIEINSMNSAYNRDECNELRL